MTSRTLLCGALTAAFVLAGSQAIAQQDPRRPPFGIQIGPGGINISPPGLGGAPGQYGQYGPGYQYGQPGYQYPPGQYAPGPQYGQPGYSYGPGYGPGQGPRAYGGGPGRGFQNDLRRQMNGIETDLRDRVRQGVLDPRALDEFHDRRDAVERHIQDASQDGMITPDERSRIQRDVNRLRTLNQNYGGSGPGYDSWR